MLTSTQYDIFISYRRESGEDKARILNQYLSAVGYRVFFDHEAGMTGEFETEILAALEVAPVFLMLLTPHCFDRCKDEGDWVRREIERAIKFNKSIIPIRPNYDDTMFENLPTEVPDAVRQLKTLEYAEIDFHKNFKATAGAMVETMLKKVVSPTLVVSETDKKGARIHFFSDISCRVLHYGTPIAVTDAADKKTGAVAHLLKGRHLLEYTSIENEADSYTETYSVLDNNSEDFVIINLQAIRDERRKEEEKRRLKVEKEAAEDKARREREVKREELAHFKYDVFFSYSRQDSSIVREVCHYLRRAGYRCWIDKDLLVGQSYHEEIAEAILSSRFFLYFSSEGSNSSLFTMEELKYATVNKKPIIPIFLDDSPVPFELQFYRQYNLKGNGDTGELVRAIKQILREAPI